MDSCEFVIEKSEEKRVALGTDPTGWETVVFVVEDLTPADEGFD
jgi:hypothetical protein